jgi:hypothetical protein
MVVHIGTLIVNMPHSLGILRMFLQSFSYSSTTIRLATFTIAIAIILAASNFTSGIAQQRNQSAPNKRRYFKVVHQQLQRQQQQLASH